MDVDPIEIAASTAVTFAFGVALWPPADALWQWWEALPASVDGDFVVLSLLAAIAGAAGFGMTRLAGLGVSNLAIGGAIAYVVGMVLIGAVIQPDSPAHFPLYGVILIAVLLGAVGGAAIEPGRENRANDHTGPS